MKRLVERSNAAIKYPRQRFSFRLTSPQTHVRYVLGEGVHWSLHPLSKQLLIATACDYYIFTRAEQHRFVQAV